MDILKSLLLGIIQGLTRFYFFNKRDFGGAGFFARRQRTFVR